MTRWSYTQQPTWVIDEDCIRGVGGWVGAITGEIYVAIDQFLTKADIVVDNFELENGFNLILEDDSLGPCFLQLES